MAARKTPTGKITKVNVYLGDKLIKPEDLHKLQIKSKTIDRIINGVTRQTGRPSQESGTPIST